MKNVGDPVYATKAIPDSHYTQLPAGMSLRDYFAAKALQGPVAAILAQYDGRERAQLGGDEFSAKRAYQIADAMLKQREK
jgi:hypothetical protein